MKKRLLSLIAIIAVSLIIIFGMSSDKKQNPASIKNFTAFFDVTGGFIDPDNDIQEVIAQKTGAKVTEVWLSGQTKEEAVNTYIANKNYPDYISGNASLYNAGALIPLDEYWDEYPNIRNYLTDDEWNKFRLDDGHIYWIPQFGVVRGEGKDLIHEGEAFWIQTRVLKWAGYPEVRTVDQYFDLLESYVAENPTMADGTQNIPFTILCDDWKYFCLENVPQFLDGYPNDGSCAVDPITHRVVDYNTTPTARTYFQKLNEEFKKGIVDPGSFTQSYEEYILKLSTGAVLGMVDQRWDFAYGIANAYAAASLGEQGCDYVPLPITISEDVHNQWHTTRKAELDTSSGISITVNCKDIPGAMQFINDLLDEEIVKLRFWGIEGVDYYVDENGYYCQTLEQKINAADPQYQQKHNCTYAYFPRFEGTYSDGKNSFAPEHQESVFFESQPLDVQECFNAYGVKSYVEMIGDNEAPGRWFPMYSYTDSLTYETAAGKTWEQMTGVKQKWLPRVVTASDFETAWDEYILNYYDTNPDILFYAMQIEVDKRIKGGEDNHD